MKKKCNSCGEELPIEYFRVDKRIDTGIASICKKCANKSSREWKEKHPEQYAKALWRCRLKKEYGITEKDYDRMYMEQLGVCAICEKPETRQLKGKTTLLCVDHDHETGKVRGLLCHRCNTVIGMFTDTDLLDSAKRYLIERKQDDGD